MDSLGRHARPSASRIGTFLLVAACASTLWALFVNNVTLAGNAYTSVVIQAVVCAASAIVLVVLAWKWMPTYGRVIGAVLVALNVWTLVDAGGRRLPAVLGW